MKRDLATIVENNVKFIQQYSFDEWVSKLKLVAIACIPFLSSAKIKEIMDKKVFDQNLGIIVYDPKPQNQNQEETDRD